MNNRNDTTQRISLTRALILELCLHAFTHAKWGKNQADGGPTDWVNDTLPTVEAAIDTFIERDEKQADVEEAAQSVMREVLSLPEDTLGRQALLQAVSALRGKVGGT